MCVCVTKEKFAFVFSVCVCMYVCVYNKTTKELKNHKFGCLFLPLPPIFLMHKQS